MPAGSGRIELAQWLTDPDHPLVSRVLVNRVWMHLFGEACIATHELLPGGDVMIDIARERLASIGEWVVADTPGGHDALRSIVDPRLTDVVGQLVATNRTVASSTVRPRQNSASNRL